jgi:hypothetical protein
MVKLEKNKLSIFHLQNSMENGGYNILVLRSTKKVKSVRGNVVTLALGLRPRKGLARVWAKREAQKSHLMFPRMWENVKE